MSLLDNCDCRTGEGRGDNARDWPSFGGIPKFRTDQRVCAKAVLIRRSRTPSFSTSRAAAQSLPCPPTGPRSTLQAERGSIHGRSNGRGGTKPAPVDPNEDYYRAEPA